MFGVKDKYYLYNLRLIQYIKREVVISGSLFSLDYSVI